MKILLNKYWNRIEICYNESSILVNNITYPIYNDYYIETRKEFNINSESIELLGEQNEYWLFDGVDGEYIYLTSNLTNKEIELWGTDGKGKDMYCYAKYKDNNWIVD